MVRQVTKLASTMETASVTEKYRLINVALKMSYDMLRHIHHESQVMVVSRDENQHRTGEILQSKLNIAMYAINEAHLAVTNTKKDK